MFEIGRGGFSASNDHKNTHFLVFVEENCMYFAPILRKTKIFQRMKTIEITTAHNIVLEYEVASARERMFAFAFDIVAVMMLNTVLQVILAMVLRSVTGNHVGILFSLMPFALLIAYLTLMEIFNNGQTLGKMIAKIRTVRLDGRQPSWSEMLGRAALQFVDSIFSIGFIGLMMINTTEKSQRLGDMAAGTTVIRLHPSLTVRLFDVLNLNTVKEWKPLFPQVRTLREADMLAIKTIVGRYLKYPNDAHYDVVVEASEKLADLLDIRPLPPDRVGFLKNLLKDYVVLTR